MMRRMRPTAASVDTSAHGCPAVVAPGAPAALDADAAYLALRARDPRFDGRLFVGVTSTGIYCRPVCRVRTPRRENCRFFASAAQAEAARFRPCLKCRPEIAPGLSAMDSPQVLAAAAARLIDDGVARGDPVSVAGIAARLGITDRHLRRIFHAAHGVAPQDWLTTQRLLLAKRLLSDTAEPVAQVALASGFGSLRRFNAAFATRYRMPPSRLRREAAQTPAADGPLLRLPWRPPYDVDAMLGFVARRALPDVEQVDGPEIRRTLSWLHAGRRLDGWLVLRFAADAGELQLRTAPALAPVLGALIALARQAFDLDAEPARIDPVLARLPVPPRPGLRLAGALDGFETAVRVILGQQVSVAAARTLAARLVARFGRPVATPWSEASRLFPDAATLAAADPGEVAALGIVHQRVRAMQALAAEVCAGRIELAPGPGGAATADRLRALPGVGEWTMQMIALRVLGAPDAWPDGDIGLLKALGTRDRREAAALADAWRPWRSYAVMRLWLHLETA
jgi:AraC family transcriptional regulator of adaptative response / DNA-3-methyladenine glycosylase II